MATSTSHTPHGTNKHFYDRISNVYDSIANANEHTARELGETLIDLQPGEQVLEIGFGTGNSIIKFAQMVGSNDDGGKVCGVDVSRGMKQVAQAKIDKAGISNVVELNVGNAVKLDYPDETFDAIFMSFTLELFEKADLELVLQECKRVLQSTGRLGVVGMAAVRQGEHESVLEKAYIWMHRHFPQIVDCRPLDFDSVIQKNGFTIDKEERIDIWTMPVAVIVARKQKVPLMTKNRLL
jgi:demethylmenaquinone methyltransferase/2-methoxy-6-polyprenyl-1,4-benzoquinol methylase